MLEKAASAAFFMLAVFRRFDFSKFNPNQTGNK
jgi:hypothetical protein